jgi:hypothetical protein
MSDEKISNEKIKISYEDIEPYESLLAKAPAFALKGMIKRETNVVSKFKSQVVSRLPALTPENEAKLDAILNTPESELQEFMKEAYQKSGKKQYKLLADPKAENFIRKNLEEVRKIMDNELN